MNVELGSKYRNCDRPGFGLHACTSGPCGCAFHSANVKFRAADLRSTKRTTADLIPEQTERGREWDIAISPVIGVECCECESTPIRLRISAAALGRVGAAIGGSREIVASG